MGGGDRTLNPGSKENPPKKPRSREAIQEGRVQPDVLPALLSEAGRTRAQGQEKIKGREAGLSPEEATRAAQAKRRRRSRRSATARGLPHSAPGRGPTAQGRQRWRLPVGRPRRRQGTPQSRAHTQGVLDVDQPAIKTEELGDQDQLVRHRLVGALVPGQEGLAQLPALFPLGDEGACGTGEGRGRAWGPSLLTRCPQGGSCTSSMARPASLLDPTILGCQSDSLGAGPSLAC